MTRVCAESGQYSVIRKGQTSLRVVESLPLQPPSCSLVEIELPFYHHSMHLSSNATILAAGTFTACRAGYMVVENYNQNEASHPRPLCKSAPFIVGDHNDKTEIEYLQVNFDSIVFRRVHCSKKSRTFVMLFD
jgi:hypothetical protein